MSFDYLPLNFYLPLNLAAKDLSCIEEYLIHLAANRLAKIHVLTGPSSSCTDFEFNDDDDLVELRKPLPSICLVPFDFWMRIEAGENCLLNSLTSINSKNLPYGIGDVLYSAPWYDCAGREIEFNKFVILRDELERLKHVSGIAPIQSEAEGNDCSSLESDCPKSWLTADPEDPETEQVSYTPTVTIDETMKSDSNNTVSDDGQDDKLAALFDPVPVEVLAKMFPTDKQCSTDKWKRWQYKALTNGLKEARVGRAIFNPYKAGMWFLTRKIPGWDIDRINRVLAKNLPARSLDEKYQLTGEID